MAFGLFKKKEIADLILYNAHIYTNDPELPWAEAVAIKEDSILSAGNFEDMEHLTGSDTETKDLEGRYVYPGFIDVHRSPVMRVFKDKYLDLSSCDTIEELCDALADWADENPDNEVVFGYGYKSSLKPSDEASEIDCEEPEGSGLCEDSEEDGVEGDGVEEDGVEEDGVEGDGVEGDGVEEDGVEEDGEGGVEADLVEVPETASARVLNEVISDRPVVLLSEDCVGCWTNTAADAIILSTAEEECVRIITTSYVLNLLLPFDFEEIVEDVKGVGEELADQGFTSVLNLQTPDYFEDLYMDAIIGLNTEEELNHRFFGSYFANRALIPQGLVHRLMQRKTNCLELGDLIHAETFNLLIDNENMEHPFTEEILEAILVPVCDKGFSIFLEAVGPDDLILSYGALESVRQKGYKNVFIIASDYELSDEDAGNLIYWESAVKTWGTEIDSPLSVYGDVNGMEERIEELTTIAAEYLGLGDKLGSIERGKWADLTIFEENLFDLSARQFNQAHCDMTVVAGKIVYDAQEAADDELMEMLIHEHF